MRARAPGSSGNAEIRSGGDARSLRRPWHWVASLDQAAAARGRVVFNRAGQCSVCHTGALLTDIDSGTLHAPSKVASEPEPNGAPRYALRSVTKMHRTTLNLTAQQKADLVQYLRSL